VKKAKDFRYKYVSEPKFKVLSEKRGKDVYRVEAIYLAKGLKPEEITGIPNLPIHSQY